MKITRAKVFLIGVNSESEDRDQFTESMEELNRLTQTAGAEIIRIFSQNLKKTDTATYIGSGKLREIRNAARQLGVNTLIFNNNLSPSQARNISDSTGCNVVDRTELILDIFATHARTRQAKLQVELAQLEYSFTKLKHMWKHLSRIEGGIGFRGPGEKQIEVDRREIRKRINILKEKLEEIKTASLVKRKKRQIYPSISLVGYTNAGKSTLFNKITSENRYTADQLFATLDALTRIIKLSSGEKAILTDTIGFINDLPHKLISSFHSTLLEVLKADLLLHVVDVSHPSMFDNIEAVNKVLRELGVERKNILYVFNKTDRMTGNYYVFLRKKIINKFPDSVFISALSGIGLESLDHKIQEFFRLRKRSQILKIPLALTNLIKFLRENAEVIDEKADLTEKVNVMEVKISRKLYPNVIKQIEDYKLKEYINS